MIVLTSASSADGQARKGCAPINTIDECFKALEPSPASPSRQPDPDAAAAEALQSRDRTGDAATVAMAAGIVADFAEQEEREDLTMLPTGVDTSGTSLASNRKNLLPLLSLTGLLNQNGDLDDSGTFALDLNFLVPQLDPGKNVQLQGLVNTKPQVSGALREALPEAERDTLLSSIGGELTDTDDLALTFTYSPNSRELGRSFEPHEAAFEALAAAAVSSTLSAASVARSGLAIGQAIVEQGGDLEEDVSEQRLEHFPDPIRDLVVDQGLLLASLESVASRQMSLSGLDRFHELVDNQPQWHFTATRRFRNSLVGPEELGIKLTYEMGMANVNELREVIGERCLQEGALADGCLSRYSAYVTNNAAAIDKAHRFSFSGEYVELDDDVIDPGIEGLDPLVVDSASKLILSVGWSRHFDVGDSDPILLDLVGSYEDVSDDPMRQDRGVITLTITRNFAGVPVPLGIVYANHGEYLGDVDERLSAHVGLKFNAFGTKKK